MSATHNPARFQITKLGTDAATHIDRATFQCGSVALDRYFHTQVTQDMRRRVTSCFVALPLSTQQAAPAIAGYYTLAMAGLILNDLPSELAKKPPRYPTVPVVRMGRLAVGSAHQGCGLGAALLADALVRVAQSDIAAYALLVDTKDETAARFYRHHGFLDLPSQPLTFFLPLASLPAF